jgi:hypothetical protein
MAIGRLRNTSLAHISSHAYFAFQGCGGIPTFDHVAKFRLTLFFMLITGILFALACLFRFYVHVRSHIFHVQDEQLADDAEEENQEAETPEAEDLGHESQEAEPTRIRVSRRLSTTDFYRPPTSLRTPVKLSLCHPIALWKNLRGLAAYVDLKQRLIHAALILLSIFYLRMSTLAFKSFRCVSAADPVTSTSSDAVVTYSLVLKEDLQVRLMDTVTSPW